MEIIKQIFPYFATIGGLVSFVFGVLQYIKAQKLKHLDNLFIIRKDIETFIQLPEVTVVFKLIDYNEFLFEKYQKVHSKLEDVYFNDKFISYSLRPHSKGGVYHLFEVHIRELFDLYFTELEKYYYYLKIGVFDKDFLYPYLGYYIKIHGDSNPQTNNRKDISDIQSIHNYIITYYSNNLCKFFKAFGYIIKYQEIKYIKPEGYDEWLSKMDAKILESESN